MNTPDVICRSGHRLPESLARLAAVHAYGYYALNPVTAENLGKLSTLIDNQFDTQLRQRLCGHSVLASLTGNGFLKPNLIQINQQSLMMRGLVGANMVEATVYDDDIDVGLREPFVNQPIIEALVDNARPLGPRQDDGFVMRFER